MASKLFPKLNRTIVNRFSFCVVKSYHQGVNRFRQSTISQVQCTSFPRVSNQHLSHFSNQSAMADPGILKPEERVTPQLYNEEVFKTNKPHLLIDVRPMDHQKIVKLDHSISLPLDQIVNGNGVEEMKKLIQEKLGSVEGKKQVFVMCKLGIASQKAVRELKNRLANEVSSGEVEFRDIIGGITRWSKEIDSSVPTY